MAIHYILRRRSLGRTSAREIARNSEEGILVYRDDGKIYNHDTNRYIPVGGLPETDGYVFRWGCTSPVPGNPKIINKVSAIHQVNDKRLFRLTLSEANLAPESWITRNDFPHTNDEDFEADGRRFIVRRGYHAQGRNLHVCNTYEEVMRACNIYRDRDQPYYISELIDKVAEYRVCVAFGRVVWVANKYVPNPSQVAWNVAQGGSFSNVPWNNWPLKVVKTACAAFFLSDLDFGGVDVMVDAQGKCYVLEINSAMSLTSPYRQQCTAKVFDYVIRNGKEHIPMVSSLGDWKKFIHPALSPEASMV